VAEENAVAVVAEGDVLVVGGGLGAVGAAPQAESTSAAATAASGTLR
jgi:hypothetical protein